MKKLLFNVFPENQLENSPNGGLDKEKLCKKRKREVKAHKLKPVRKQGNDVKARVIGVVQKRRDKAHCGTHKSNGGADYGGFKNNGVSFPRVKDLAGKPEGRGASHYYFQ